MAKRQIVVIGLGRFGSNLVRELVAHGHEVLGIDTNMRAIEEAADFATQTVQADATDEATLRELGVGDFDTGVVSIGTDLKSSILITLLLKRMGVPTVIGKAQDELHGEILSKIGADVIVYPEREAAVRVAHTLATGPNVVDYMELSPAYGIAKIEVPEALIGRHLEQTDLDRRFGLTVLAIRRGDRVILNPSRYETIERADILIVAGSDEKMEDLRKA